MADHRKSVYAKIRRAALRGTGCRLTADECFALYQMDTAFRWRADMDAEGKVGPDDPVTPDEIRGLVRRIPTTEQLPDASWD